MEQPNSVICMDRASCYGWFSASAAYKNAGGEIDLPEALLEMMNRGKTILGGVCGFWDACGAGISTGMFISIISGATPLKDEPWSLANKMTSKHLTQSGALVYQDVI